MLRRALQGRDNEAVGERMKIPADLCVMKPMAQKLVICYETDGPQICRMDIRETVTIKKGGTIRFQGGPAVEVSVLQPYSKPQDYPDERPWIVIMADLMMFTFDELVQEYPEAADMRPFAILPDTNAANAWKDRLADYGVVEIRDTDNGTLVYWGSNGTVRKLLNVRGQ